MKIRHIRALLLLMMATCVLPIQAQIRGSEIQVNVVPDHQDWTYERWYTDAERQDDKAGFLSCRCEGLC